VVMKLSKQIFSFIKYVQPGWYFLLPAFEGSCYWVDVQKLTVEDCSKIDLDYGYRQRESMLRDAAYQLLLKGFISADKNLSLILTDGTIPIADEYRFLRRHYHAWWSWYVFVLRCFTFHNPVQEFRGFMQARRVKRLALYAQVYSHVVRENLETLPLVSVIIPTLNRYEHLRNILHDLELQTHQNFEVIVIDQSSPYRPDFYLDFKLKLKVIRQDEPGLWKARNRGVVESRAAWIAFSEDDVRVKEDWLLHHLACVFHFGVEISAGIFFPEGTTMPVHRSNYRWAEQFASGNALVNRSVFERVGLFDLQFERMRMGDGEFGLRAYLAGVKSISNPKAYALDVKAPVGGLRQMGSWDGFRPTNWFGPRPIPSVLYLTRRYFGNKLSILDLLVKVPPSIIPFRFKRRPVLLLLASFLSTLIFPLILFQVFQSWRKASKMIEEGPKISNL